MIYKRGEVVLVLFPDSNLQTAKKRPALVVQSDNLNSGLPQIIVALITSNLARRGHKSRIEITLNSMEGKLSGLKTDSIIATDNLATLQEIFIYKTLGNLANLTALNEALKHTLDLQ